MATVKKNSRGGIDKLSQKEKRAQGITDAPKVKAQYTTTGGQKVTLYTDGTKKYGASATTTPADDLLRKGEAMLEQTKAEGSTPFKGSKYDTGFEPTVLSDTTIREDVIPDINARLDKFAETGQYYDANGNLYNADGSLSDTNGKEETGADFTTGTGSAEADALLESAEDDSALIMSTLDKLMKQTDKDTASQIRSIEAQYDALRTAQQEVNRREQLSTDTALLLGGSSRYTTSGTGISAGIARAGIMELAELDAMEASAIAEAKALQNEQNYKLASEKLDYIETLRKEKIQKATDIAKSFAEESKKLRERMEKQTVESAIVDLFRQGITDPGEIQNYLNYYEDGSPTGGFIDLKTIQNTLSIVNPAENLKGASADYQTFKIMQANGDIPKDWSFFDYKTAVTNAGSSGGGGFTATEKRKLEQAGLLDADRQAQLDYLYGDGEEADDLSPEDKRTLRGAGFSSEEISDLGKAVRDFGIDAALGELDDRKARAAKSVYNVVNTDQFLTEEFFEDLFTEDQLKDAADEAGYRGFFSSWEDEKDAYLKALVKTVESKRKMGMTDEEIYKEMQ